MSYFRKAPGAGIRIAVLSLLVVVLISGGIVWFDYIGFINVKEKFPFLFFMDGREKTVSSENPDDLLLLEKERFLARQEALTLETDQQEQKKADLAMWEAELKQKEEILNEREKVLEEREKSFNVRVRLYENKVANLEQTSKYLTGMPPEKAKDILLNMEDQDIIDVMRVTERLAQEEENVSIVAYWLSLMPPERSAGIQKKMTLKPDFD